jgi:hypothetical protein
MPEFNEIPFNIDIKPRLRSRVPQIAHEMARRSIGSNLSESAMQKLWIGDFDKNPSK